jgi:hypothetical protein
MIGPVHQGPEVFGRRETHELPELVGEMRLIAVAVPGGRRGPVNLEGRCPFRQDPAGAR